MVQQTSLLAYYELNKDIRNERYKMIMDALKENGAMTDREICSYLRYSDPNKVRPRRNELVKYGILKAIGKRICKISKKKSMVWYYAR